MLANSPIIISEIEAANSSGIVDSAGNAADWLEITNTSSTQTVNLANWKLEYNTAPTIWTFPSMNLGPGESRVIFCDSASATDPTQELHTNFNLSKSGKNLLLVDNLGNTIQSFTPYPAMTSNISYGVGETVSETDLVAAGATAKYFAPTNGNLGTTWTQPGFNDSSWASGPTGLGYAVVNGFATTLYKANTGSVASLAQANTVISTPSQQTSTFSQTSSVLNFVDTGGDGHFGSDSPFPGMTINQGLSYYVLQATGSLTISAAQAGFYTFGANSDDGFSLSITGANFGNGVNTTTASGATMASDKLQGPTDTFATTFLAAGTYPVNLVYYQNAGGAEMELFAEKVASSSGVTSFNSSFHLVGDTANGGLTVTSVPFSGSGGSRFAPGRRDQDKRQIDRPIGDSNGRRHVALLADHLRRDQLRDAAILDTADAVQLGIRRLSERRRNRQQQCTGVARMEFTGERIPRQRRASDDLRGRRHLVVPQFQHDRAFAGDGQRARDSDVDEIADRREPVCPAGDCSALDHARWAAFLRPADARNAQPPQHLAARLDVQRAARLLQLAISVDADHDHPGRDNSLHNRQLDPQRHERPRLQRADHDLDDDECPRRLDCRRWPVGRRLDRVVYLPGQRDQPVGQSAGFPDRVGRGHQRQSAGVELCDEPADHAESAVCRDAGARSAFLADRLDHV